jgi:hypothetical protein
MGNPFDPAYLSTTSAQFGPLAWAFFIAQIAGVAGGLYLAFGRQGSNVLQTKLFKQLGYAIIALCGLGVLLGALRLGSVSVFTMRFWFYLVLLVELGFAGYAAYYARFIYPKELSTIHTSRGKPRGSSTRRVTTSREHSGNGHADTHQEEAAAARGGRREARHRRKRKSRH